MPLSPTNRSSGLAIDAQGLARRFGERWVLRGLSLQLARGEVVGVLGRNGAGKSTLLRIVATLLRPNVGSATVLGHDVLRDPDAVRRIIGFLAHTPGLYDDLTAAENLRFSTHMHGRSAAGIPAALERVGLLDVANERVRGFSAGMQRRLALARLFLNRSPVLLLDEPYSNLDVAGVALMNEVITEFTSGEGAALVVLHELAPAAGLLHRTVSIADGRLADEITPGAETQAAPVVTTVTS